MSAAKCVFPWNYCALYLSVQELQFAVLSWTIINF